MSARRRYLRHSDRPRGPLLKFLFGALRYLVYGILGVAAEVFFYTLIKTGRHVPLVRDFFLFNWQVDARLDLNHVWDLPILPGFGQSSFWMFFVYGTCAFFLLEPLYRRFVRVRVHVNVFARGLAYGAVITAWEFVSGYLLLWITGYRIWQYTDAGNLLGMTSLLILPVWGVTGLIVETVYRELMYPAVREALEASLR